LDNLIGNIEARVENHDIIDHMSVFAMGNTDTLAGNDEIKAIAEHSGYDVDQALFEWDQLKQCLRDSEHTEPLFPDHDFYANCRKQQETSAP
jgi:hypothetical protein